ncbi:MAG: PqqD family protein [Gemmatimonadetes bacterium]|nr:PqqD family protein [Gemmatimonadota bacterium]
MRPVARKKRLLVEEVEGETLVYDLRRHKAHCLNDIAAFVWERCDGSNTVEDLMRLAETELGVTSSEEFIWLALDRLKESALLEQPVEDSDAEPHAPRHSRREVLKSLAKVGVVLPLVASIAVPTPAQAATVVSNTECRNLPASVGSCCTNGKICIDTGRRRQCAGAPC